MKKELLVVYHKNCLDGVSSAYVVREYLRAINKEEESTFLPLQHSDNIFEILTNKDYKDDVYNTIYFVDFSLSYDNMISLSKSTKKIIIIDHHKTAEENLEALKDNDKFEINFDMEESGASLCYQYFSKKLNKNILEKKEVFDYIKDRDIWNFELENSKEVSEATRILIKPNDLDSFDEFYMNWDFQNLTDMGSVLLKKTEISVKSKIKKNKLKNITLNGVLFKCCNATDNLSDIGNGICLKYNIPAAMYFILPNNKVIFSLRSTDELPDASEVAKANGGGGHRNACGFETTFNHLSKILGSEGNEDNDEQKVSVKYSSSTA
jgi:oligoribonuclease NrnB/cAMP/cGMP phosphodiesterase (DHH superfamily)